MAWKRQNVVKQAGKPRKPCSKNPEISKSCRFAAFLLQGTCWIWSWSHPKAQRLLGLKLRSYPCVSVITSFQKILVCKPPPKWHLLFWKAETASGSWFLMVILAAFAGHSECFLVFEFGPFSLMHVFAEGCDHLVERLPGNLQMLVKTGVWKSIRFSQKPELWWSLLPQPRSGLELRKQSEKKRVPQARAHRTIPSFDETRQVCYRRSLGPFGIRRTRDKAFPSRISPRFLLFNPRWHF